MLSKDYLAISLIDYHEATDDFGGNQGLLQPWGTMLAKSLHHILEVWGSQTIAHYVAIGCPRCHTPEFLR